MPLILLIRLIKFSAFLEKNDSPIMKHPDATGTGFFFFFFLWKSICQSHPLIKELISELKRIFDNSGLRLALSLIQAPVFHTYSIMTRCLLEKEASIPDLEDLFKNALNFELGSSIPSCPASSVAVAGKDQIYIGRIKKDESFPRSFWIWIVADNLTRGSSVNALEIAEEILSAPPN